MENLNKNNLACLVSRIGRRGGDEISTPFLKAQSVRCFFWARRDKKVVAEKSGAVKYVF